MSTSVRMEDYYSDQDSPPPIMGRHGNNQRSTSSNRSSPSNHYQQQNQRSHSQSQSPMFRKRIFRERSALPPRQYYAMSDNDLTGSEEDDEEEIQRAMHDLGLQDHPQFPRYSDSRPLSHRSSIDYELHGPPVSPSGYYMPQNHYEHDLDFSPYGPPLPPYLMQDNRYPPHPPPPPPPPPPHPQWMSYQQMMLDEMSPHMGPMYQPQPMDLPFVHRSASSRSYNRRNRPNIRPATSASRRQEMFLSHDEDNELDDGELYYDDDVESDQDVYTNQFPPRMQPLSRQSSISSSNGLRPFLRKRSNSLSAMPPPPPPHPPSFMMDSPRRQPPGNYFYPPTPLPPSHQRLNSRFVGPPRRMVHSVPTSPQLSITSDSSSEDYAPPPSRRASINASTAVGHPNNHHNGRIGRSMSFSGGFPPHAAVNMAPPPPPPPPPPPSASIPPIVLHPLTMPHPMMDNPSRRNSMYSLPSSAMGGDFFDQMMNPNQQQQQQQQQAATAPVTPIDNPPSANASAAGDIPMNSQSSQQPQPPLPSVIAAAANMQQKQQQQQPMNMQIPPPPPPQQMHHWGNGFPTSPGEPNIFNQQGMMQPPPHPPSQMMLPPMFNNPMMGQNPMMNQNPMWNFMPEMMFGQGGGGDFPLPFMYSSDPNLIAQAMSGGGPNFGGPGGMDGSNNMHSPLMNMNGNPGDGPSGSNAGPSSGAGNNGGGGGGPPPSHEEDMMRRSAGGGGNEPPNPHDMMMMSGLAHPPPPNSAPMLKRGLSMLGGLFGGGNGGGSHREDFHGGPSSGSSHPMFGNFSAPIQAQSKKEAKLQRQYEELGTFYCWRRMEGPDQHFESFSIDNQKLIKKKLNKAQPQTQIMLKREKKLPGEIMVDLQQNRGCYLVKMSGDPVVVMLEIEQKSYGSNNYVFGGGNGGDGQQQQHQQGPPHQW